MNHNWKFVDYYSFYCEKSALIQILNDTLFRTDRLINLKVHYRDQRHLSALLKFQVSITIENFCKKHSTYTYLFSHLNSSWAKLSYNIKFTAGLRCGCSNISNLIAGGKRAKCVRSVTALDLSVVLKWIKLFSSFSLKLCALDRSWASVTR